MHETWKNLFITASIAALSLSTFFIYRGTLDNFFLKDDAILINEGKKRGCEAVQIYFYETTDGPRRCVLGLFYKLFRRAPTGYHAVALFAHIINTCFLFAVFATLFSFLQPLVRYLLAASGAMLFSLQFSVHEAVLWLSGIDEILLSFFLFPSFLCFILSQRKKITPNVFYLTSFFLYFIASFTKVATWIFPVILLSYAWLMLDDKASFLKALRLTLPFFAVSFIHAVIFLSLSASTADKLFFAQIRNGYVLYNLVYYLSDFFLSLAGAARGPFLASEMYNATLGNLAFVVRLLKGAIIFSAVTLSYLFVKGMAMRMRFFAGITTNSEDFKEAKKITLFGFLWMFIFFLPFACHLYAPVHDKFFGQNNLIHWRYLYFPCGGFCLMLTGALLSVCSHSAFIDKKPVATLLVSLFFISTITVNGIHSWYVEKMYDGQGKHAQYLAETIHKNYKSVPQGSDVYLSGLPNGLQIHQASMTPFEDFLYNAKINVFWFYNDILDYCDILVEKNNSYFLEYSNAGLTDTTPWRKQSCGIKY